MYGKPVDESQLRKPPQQSPPGPASAGEARAADPQALAGRANPQAPAAEADLRASDADRDRVADILRDALAEGRLDAAEHSERIEKLYRAKTLGELEPLVRDLPAARTPAAAPAPAARTYATDPSGENPHLVAVLSGAERKGRWRVGNRITAVAILGGVEIDLTEATFTSPELVIHCTAIMGGITVKLPENVTLHGGGVVGIMGGSDIKAFEAPDPQAPVVRIDGVAFWGGVEARARRGKKVADWTKKRLDR